MHEDDIEPKTP